MFGTVSYINRAALYVQEAVESDGLIIARVHQSIRLDLFVSVQQNSHECQGPRLGETVGMLLLARYRRSYTLGRCPSFFCGTSLRYFCCTILYQVLVYTSKYMVLFAPVRVVPSCMPIYIPKAYPSQPRQTKGSNQHVGCRASSFSEFQIVFETHPAGVFLVCVASAVRSSDSLVLSLYCCLFSSFDAWYVL